MTFSEAAGWIGTILILAAYVLVSFKRLDGRMGILYHLLNLIGAAGLAVNVFQKALPAFTVNCIWMGIALVALVRIVRSAKPHLTKF